MLLAVTLLFGSCLTVSAADDAFENITYFEQIPIDISKYVANYPTRYILAVRSENTYRLYLSDYPFSISRVNSTYYVECSGEYYINQSYDSFEVGNFWLRDGGAGQRYVVDVKNVSVWSSHNIYCNSQLVFRNPDLSLVEVVRGIAPEEVMKEIIAMIPLTIPLLASYRGLRVGLRMLWRVLRAA